MIRFVDLKTYEQQAFADFLYKEKQRHMRDIEQINKDLRQIKDLYNVSPRDIYCEWVQI